LADRCERYGAVIRQRFHIVGRMTHRIMSRWLSSRASAAPVGPVAGPFPAVHIPELLAGQVRQDVAARRAALVEILVQKTQACSSSSSGRAIQMFRRSDSPSRDDRAERAAPGAGAQARFV